MIKINKYYFILSLCISLLLPNDVVAAIASLKGNVQIRENQGAKYLSAYKGQMIQNGNWIKTDNGVFVSIIFLDGTNVKIHQKTEIEIKSSRITAKELKTNMYIAEGEAWSTVNEQTNGEFKVETPTAVASVKGTEFDINYDFNNGSTTLKVISGEVEFGNDDIGLVLASAMEGVEINKDTQEITKYEITEEDIPKWENKIQSNFGFNITPNKSGKIPLDTPLKSTIQVKNIDNDTDANSFNEIVTINAEDEHILVSKSGNSWSSKIDLNVNDGKSTFYIKSIKGGSYSIIISSKDAESKKLTIDFYQTESQKKSNMSKVFDLAKDKGYTNIVSAIENMELESSKIISGSISLEEVIDKIKSNDYEIIKFTFKEEGDKILIELEVEPKN